MPRFTTPLGTLSGIGLMMVLALSASPAPAHADPLRVMTFNIRYGTANDGQNSWPERREAVAETIRRFDPDLLGVQEALAFQVEFLREQLPGYQILGVGRDDGRRRGEFAAILVRESRIAVTRWGTRWLSESPDEPGSITWGGKLPRVFTWADLKLKPTGDPLRVVTTHWDHQSQESREKSAAAIAEYLRASSAAAAPVIVMGDLNAGPDNPAVKLLLSDQTGLADSYAAANPARPRVATFNGFRENPRGEQIDWLLTSKPIRVESAGVTTTRIAGRYPSDHFPVWAVVEIDE